MNNTMHGAGANLPASCTLTAAQKAAVAYKIEEEKLALDVGIDIAELDIEDLTSALNNVTAPDVIQIYTNLRKASQHRLTAFGG